jgi:hypothetical protein
MHAITHVIGMYCTEPAVLIMSLNLVLDLMGRWVWIRCILVWLESFDDPERDTDTT